MMKAKAVFTLVSMYLLTLIWAVPSMGQMTNASYRIPADTLNGGGSQGSSEGFRLIGSIGLSSPVGSIQNTEFEIRAGFIPQLSESHLNKGLVAYYPFNGNANDESGNGNHGTVHGATLTEDRFGNDNSAYSFDGVDDYISVSDAPNLDFESTAPITISAWLFVTHYTGHPLGKRAGCELGGINYQIFIDPTGHMYFWLWIDTEATLPLNSWVHLVSTFDGTTHKAYINGVLAGTREATHGEPNDAELRIGTSGDCENFAGLIDDVRIYNRPLPESEIQELYHTDFHIYPGKSIQNTIDLAKDGDEVILHPGTYAENLDFSGKAITIRSVDPDSPSIVAATIIDGNQQRSVVTFNSGEGNNSAIRGLTLQNGYGTRGGGICCNSSSPTISNCIIVNNSSSAEGGGIACWDFSSPYIDNCIIIGNESPQSWGGGIASWNNSSPIINNCTISDNSAYWSGGGVSCHNFCSPTIINCTITNNSSEWDGGGVHFWDNCSSTILNCTIYRNSATNNGGGVFSGKNSLIVLTNCILWQNTLNNSPQQIATSGGSIEISYSDVQGGYTGTGNISADPLFIDPNAGDYHLRYGSPCIDVGAGEEAPNIDRDGNPRPSGSGYDMGAYEFDWSSVDLDTGLIAYYPFNGNARDESGNGNHGTVHGATLTEDRFGNPTSAYVFDGVDDYVDCGQEASLNPGNGSFTIGLWIKPEELSGLKRFVWKNNGTTPPFDGYYIMTLDSAVSGGFGDGSNSVEVSGGTLNPSVWYFVTVVRDINTDRVILYLDGVKISEEMDTSGNIVYSGNLAIGGRLPLLTEMFKGSIDDVRIYNRVLSEPEIQQLYSLDAHDSIAIDEGEYTTSSEIHLTLSSQGATEMMISEDPEFAGATWEAYQSDKSFALSSGDGEKTIYVKFRDASGQETEVFGATVVLDTSTPTISIDKPSAGNVARKVIPVIASVTDTIGISKVELRVDGVLKQAWEEDSAAGITNKIYTYEWDTRQEDDGFCDVKVVAYDVAGNSKTQQIQVIVNNKILDLNGDGYADIIFSNHYDDTTCKINSYIYWGSSTGYGETNRTELPTHGAYGNSVADLNQDGYLDIIFSNYHDDTTRNINSYIYWGSSTGYGETNRTELPTHGAVGNSVADLNQDGYPDVIFSNYHDDTTYNNNSYIYWGSSTGYGETNRTELPTHGAYGNTVADLNQDGYPDVIFSNSHDDTTRNINSYIYWGSSTGYGETNRTELPTHEAHANTVADLNQDGYPDIIFSNSHDDTTRNINSYIYWGSSTGYGETNRTELPTHGARSNTVADLNQDGYLDIIFSNVYDDTTRNINSYIYWGSSTGYGETNRTELPTHGAVGNTVADLNQDGYPDIIFSNCYDDTTYNINSYIYWGSSEGYSAADRAELPTQGTTYVNASTVYGEIPEVPVTDSIVIQEGNYTGELQLHLILYSPNATEMIISEDPDFNGALWEPYQVTTDFTLSAEDGAKTVYAKFRRADGSESEVVSDSIIYDTSSPSVSIENLTDGSVVGDTAEINISATDASGITSIKLYIDNELQATLTEAPYTWTWDVPGDPGDAHTIKIIAYDFLDHSSEINITVTKNVPPTALQLTSPNGGEVIRDSHTITWQAATDVDQAESGLLYEIEYTTIHSGDPVWHRIASISGQITTTNGIGTYEWNTNGLAEGSNYKIRIRAFDGFHYGPHDESDGTFTIDQGPPTDVSIAIDEGDYTNDTQIHLSLFATGAAVDTYTKLLIHSNTINNSRIFVDSSRSSHTITPHGDVQHSTTEQKFGSSSMYFDGIGAYHEIMDSDDWDFGTGDFTVDGWIYTSSLDDAPIIFYGNVWAGTESQWVIGIHSNKLFAQFSDASSVGPVLYSNSGSLPTDVWVHFAFTRKGDTFRLFQNGVVTAAATDSIVGQSSATNWKLTIAKDNNGSTFLAGYIDELRISKGIARWTSNFTPPSAPYATSTGVSEMIISEDPNFSDTTWEPYATSKTFVLSAEDGLKTVYAKFRDEFAQESDAVSDAITLDATPPSITITSLEDGGTVSRIFPIAATVSDITSGTGSVAFSIDGEKQAEIATAQEVYTWDWDTRHYEDGEYTITVTASDILGNSQSVDITAFVSYEVPLAPTISPPAGGLTNQSPITISGTADPLSNIEIFVGGVSAGMCSSDAQGAFSCDGISLSEESNLITAIASDDIQTSLESETVEVILDTIALAPQISIDQGDYTEIPAITLAIACEHATWMILSENEDFAGAEWEAYQTSSSWTLSSGDGPKTLYAKFKKDYGFESPVATDTIILGTADPVVSMTKPVDGATIIGGGEARISITSALPMAKVEFFLDDVLQYTDTTSPYVWNFSSYDFSYGLHTLRVTAHDVLGHSGSSETKVITGDIVAPPAVTGLQAKRGDMCVDLFWTASPASDLDHYAIYMSNAHFTTVTGRTPLATTTSTAYKAQNLTNGTTYWFAVTAVDTSHNEAKVVTPVGATPQDIAPPSVTGFVATDNYPEVRLSWKTSTIHDFAAYKIYQSLFSITDVLGLTPIAQITEQGTTSYTLTDLGVKQTYYFAIVVVDQTGHTSPVSSASLYLPDPHPVVSITQPSGEATITRPTTVKATATDPDGVAQVEFFIDGTPVATDTTTPYTYDWNIFGLTSQSYTIKAEATDTKGYTAAHAITVYVEPGPPPAPTITSPASNTSVSEAEIQVTGTTLAGTQVSVFLNNLLAAGPLVVDASGHFSCQLTLSEGKNTIEATAQDAGGVSAKSAAVVVTLDLEEPHPPRLVQAASLANGKVRLSWQAPLGEVPTGYHIYRSNQTFSSTAEAQRLNVSLIAAYTYDDVPSSDGTYYYGITTVDAAGNESMLSEIIEARSDSEGPKVTELSLTPYGPVDLESGRYGPGTVDVLITVSEVLLTTPFMSITPHEGYPISINLARLSPSEYSGSFEITESTPSGVASIIFSGRDLVGNRGTEITVPHTLTIDTDGPAITQLQISPGAPVQNDAENPVVLNVSFVLDQPVKEGTIPQLWYRYAGNPDGIEITSLTQDMGNPLTWHAPFTLAPDVGVSEQDYLAFSFQALDDLDNVGKTITVQKRFEVYQGELPPLGIPVGVAPQALPGGKVKISWQAVEDATNYQLYRMAPGEGELTPYGGLIEGVSFTDETSTDGLYRYAVASVRIIGEEQALSALSASVSVMADSISPDPPQNLAIALTGSGTLITWETPEGESPASYRAYRASGIEILSTEGLTPIQSNIVGLMYLDTHPSFTEQCYAVCAVDTAGNESAPSSQYYNFQLLPVPTMTVTAVAGTLPKISWTSPGGNIVSYNAYVKVQDENIRMNHEPLLNTSIIDEGYNLSDREYTITAVDINGFESEGHTARLQVLSAELDPNSMLYRGVVNRLNCLVQNASHQVAHVNRLEVSFGGTTYRSSAFSIDPGATQEVSVVVGGDEDLPDILPLTMTLVQQPEPNTTIRTMSSAEVPVGDASFSLSIQNEALTRGSTGQVSFTLYNTSNEEIEIRTAEPGGTPSPDIRFKILDLDDNVLACVPLTQNIGDQIVSLSNGYSVARIPADQRFTCQGTDISLPLSAPDEVLLQVEIDRVYAHYSREDQVQVPGIMATNTISLIDTSYYARVLEVDPMVSEGDQPVTASGYAFDRRTNEHLGLVPVKLGFTVRGFTRYFTVYTDDTGAFSYDYTPVHGEAGFYTVWAVHPDVVDKPVQANFSILRLSISPATVDLRIPRNYTQAMTVTVKNQGESPLHNLHLAYESGYQPTGTLPEGILVTPGSARAALGTNISANLSFNIRGQDTAPSEGQLVVAVRGDEVAGGDWGLVRVNYTFQESTPALQFSPSYLEVGVGRGKSETATLWIKNAGLGSLNDISLSLAPKQGEPIRDWIKLGVTPEQGNLAAGASRNINVVFQPGESVPDGVYEYTLRISSSNYQTQDINLYATVTSSENGNALIHVWDIYEGTDDGKGGTIYGLKGASIKLQHSTLLHLIYTGTSDSQGDYLFSDLPAGKYNLRVSASGHEARAGTLFVKPGMTVNQKVFLESKLVTVEWEVVPIVIEDRYEIKITTTFETDVPAAVVTVEPAGITIPDMEVGQVFNGELIFKNHGLIRADNFTCNFPQSDQYYGYQLLAEVPDTLAAKQQIVAPYRITCRAILGEETSDASGGSGGGGAYSYSKSGDATYTYAVSSECGGSGKTPFYFSKIKTRPSTSSSTGGGDVGGTASYGYSGPGGSGGGSVSYREQELRGAECEEAAPLPPVTEGSSAVGSGPSSSSDEQGRDDCVDSRVDLVTGEYAFTVSDLSLAVNGVELEIARTYYKGNWYYTQTMDRIVSHYTKEPSHLSSLADGQKEYIDILTKGDIEYSLAGELASDYNNAEDPTGLVGQNYLYKNEVYTIRTKGGYFDDNNQFHFDRLLWKSPTGDWREYDQWGRRIAYGDRNNKRIELILEDGKNGKILGVKDATRRQVLWYAYNPDGTISAVSDYTDRRVEYFYDASGRLTRVNDVLGNDWLYAYDGSGRIITKTDPLGQKVHISYNTDGSVESVSDDEEHGPYYEYDYDSLRQEYYASILTSGGVYTERYFNKDGKVTTELINGNLNRQITYDGRTRTIKDHSGNETIKKFDEWNNLTYVQNPDGTSRSYKYDLTYSSVIEERNERGVITRYEYDDRGNRIKMIEAVGTDHERITAYTYDGQGNMTSTILPGDAVIGMEYDEYGRMITHTDAEGNVTEYTYDEYGNRTSKKDARGKLWKYGYDNSGRLVSETDPLNNVTKYEYDAAGNRAAIIDAKENRTEYTYDHHGRIKQGKDALGGTVAYEYDVDGNLIKVTDQVGNITRYEYDNEGKRTKIIDPAGNETRYVYNGNTASGCASCGSGVAHGKPSQIIYPTYTKRMEYDPMGRVTKESEMLDENTAYETQYVYDAVGNLIRKIDAEGNATAYEYDEFNRLAKVTDAAGGVTLYGYDLRDNLVSLTDAEGHTTKFGYDKNGQKTSETRPMGQVFTYTYDEEGNLATILDAKQQMTVNEYDDARRRTGVKYYSDSDHTTPVKTVAFTYDELGNLTSYDDAITSATYAYDNLSRKTEETVNYGAFSLSYSYDYHADGAKKSFTGPDAMTYSYAYNKGQLNSITIPGMGDIGYDNYLWQVPTRVNLPGGTARQIEYDPLMRIRKIDAQDSSGTTLMDYTYTRDKMGNVLTKSTEHGDYSYDYDDIYQLLNSDNPGTADEVYTYDKVGNRLIDSAHSDWDYNDNNQLTGYDGVSFAYDDNGNTMQKNDKGSITNYFYNLENRLDRVEDGSGTVIATYYYDPMGRRLMKDVGGTITYYFYSDEGLIGEYDDAGDEIKVYGYKPDSTWMTDTVFIKEADNYYYYQNDHLGTPQMLIDSTGIVVWSAKYNSFGQAEVDAASSVTNNLRFPGQYEDAERGLYYNWKRYYDSKIGRYLRSDPIGFFSKDVNLYRYARNNPTLFSDPLGNEVNMCKCLKWIKEEKDDDDWLNDLPDCSCNEPYRIMVQGVYQSEEGTSWLKDPKPVVLHYHPGADKCFRSYPPKNGATQQCCYHDGKLITWGPGAGTPDKASGKDHDNIDVDPWHWCGGKQGGWQLYNKARLPNNDKNCPQHFGIEVTIYPTPTPKKDCD